MSTPEWSTDDSVIRMSQHKVVRKFSHGVALAIVLTAGRADPSVSAGDTFQRGSTLTRQVSSVQPSDTIDAGKGSGFVFVPQQGLENRHQATGAKLTENQKGKPNTVEAPATGHITNWNSALGEGLVTEDGDGVHGVKGQNCKARLRAKLTGKVIPPDTQPVTFDVAIDNQAIDVDVDE
jgi:hypothetical protein